VANEKEKLTCMFCGKEYKAVVDCDAIKGVAVVSICEKCAIEKGWQRIVKPNG
jgi:transcription elongation factor Elf1